ncbi:CGNR zinc finger domain-containing protein [Nocardia sp. NPDC056000]|uniref:CGNR zinc finger domain-containing protein n=1 Tax=Nocardia sp. NPDC056000 TaxID=3345674 RepID=UPI0035DCCE37
MTSSRQLVSGVPDARPHLGEPLALDLLNTRWIDAEGPQDLLTDLAGLRRWLADNDLSVAVDAATLRAVVATREAILLTVRGGSADELNRVLDHGRIRRVLTPDGPVAEPDVRQAEWFPAWLAAENLLELLGAAPDRIKQCAHPNCVLWFHDTSKNGARRWHSMATCGNRAKATRHYAKKTHPDE